MPDPALSLAERLAEAREEAHALVLYVARHCPGGLEADASQAYADVLAALSPAEGTSDEDVYNALMPTYRALACHTFVEHGVHGRSVLDTIRPCPTFWARLWDKRFRAVTLGVLFFVSALLLHWIEARSQAISRCCRGCGDGNWGRYTGCTGRISGSCPCPVGQTADSRRRPVVRLRSNSCGPVGRI